MLLCIDSTCAKSWELLAYSSSILWHAILKCPVSSNPLSLALLLSDASLALVERSVAAAIRKAVQKHSGRRPDVLVTAVDSFQPPVSALPPARVQSKGNGGRGQE